MNFNAISVSRFLEEKRESLLALTEKDRVEEVNRLLAGAFKHVVISAYKDIVHV